MQHRLDLIRDESVTYLARQAGHRNHPIGGVGGHQVTVFAQLAGEIAGEIGARQIQKRAAALQDFRLQRRQHQIRNAEASPLAAIT